MRVRELALAVVAVGVALAAQQMTVANPSAVVGWVLLAAATGLIAFAVPPPAPGPPVPAVETRPAPGAWALLCGTATISCCRTSDRLVESTTGFRYLCCSFGCRA